MSGIITPRRVVSMLPAAYEYYQTGDVHAQSHTVAVVDRYLCFSLCDVRTKRVPRLYGRHHSILCAGCSDATLRNGVGRGLGPQGRNQSDAALRALANQPFDDHGDIGRRHRLRDKLAQTTGMMPILQIAGEYDPDLWSDLPYHSRE